MILLDTNVISEPLRRSPDARVIAWLDAQDAASLYLPTIVLAEIRYGIAALPEGKRKRDLRRRFEDEFLPLMADRLVPFDAPAATAYAELQAVARRQGTPLSDFDALIAATARVTGFAVATRDTAPFAIAGVAVINPFSNES
ncbi:MAG: type II toxin-antitoxin system VapC family toxin [Patulibacter sp.]